MRPSTARRGAAWALIIPVLIAGIALLVVPGRAWAHGGMGEEEEPGAMAEPGHEGGAEERETPVLELRVPKEAELGDTITIEATLTDPHDGAPIRRALITFETPAYWGEEFNGPMVIGTATTDRSGVATITSQVRDSGDIHISADFDGDAVFGPAMSDVHVDVHGSRQLYSPMAGIKVPWLNLWVLAGVIGLVWTLYFLVGLRVLAIARPPAPASTAPGTAHAELAMSTRRQFLGRLVPLGAQAGIASFGAALVTVVARSPHTHGNLLAPPSTRGYRRTPVARVGQHTEMREMPMPLDRPVSFEGEVLPIFLMNAGPHVMMPENSPPPGGIRLDTYEHVMEEEGIVVPGKPERSELVEHLLDPAMQMPPSIPPLPDEQIQLVVTWIAQGAKDN